VTGSAKRRWATMVRSENGILLPVEDGYVLRHIDICDTCGRRIIWYEEATNRNLLESAKRRKGRKRCFVCISQAMQAKYPIRMYSKKGVPKC
jgi:hypothetical protein